MVSLGAQTNFTRKEDDYKHNQIGDLDQITYLKYKKNDTYLTWFYHSIIQGCYFEMQWSSMINVVRV